jgi:hypothetical protein
LDWLVVRDLFETETASFWKDSPEVRSGALTTADIKTEVFFLPAAAVPEMDGSFTNTQRLVQWHDKAVDPPGDARSDIWFTVHLGLCSPNSAVLNNGAICTVASAPVPGRSIASYAPSAPRGTFVPWAICRHSSNHAPTPR